MAAVWRRLGGGSVVAGSRPAQLLEWNSSDCHSPKAKLRGIVAMIEGIGKLIGPAASAPMFAAFVGARPLFPDIVAAQQLLQQQARDADELSSGEAIAPLFGSGGNASSAEKAPPPLPSPSFLQTARSGAFLSFASLAAGVFLLAAYSLALPPTVERDGAAAAAAGRRTSSTSPRAKDGRVDVDGLELNVASSTSSSSTSTSSTSESLDHV